MESQQSTEQLGESGENKDCIPERNRFLLHACSLSSIHQIEWPALIEVIRDHGVQTTVRLPELSARIAQATHDGKYLCSITKLIRTQPSSPAEIIKETTRIYNRHDIDFSWTIREVRNSSNPKWQLKRETTWLEIDSDTFDDVLAEESKRRYLDAFHTRLIESEYSCDVGALGYGGHPSKSLVHFVAWSIKRDGFDFFDELWEVIASMAHFETYSSLDWAKRAKQELEEAVENYQLPQTSTVE